MSVYYNIKMNKTASTSDAASENHSYIGQDNIIYNNYVGDQNASTVRKTAEDLKELIQSIKQAHLPVHILTSLSRLGETPLSARTVGVEVLRALDFDKLAIYGPSKFDQQLVRIIVTASGRGFQIKYFTNKDEALSWLLADR